MEKEYLEKIQSGYLDFIKSQQNMRILIIDTNNIDFVNNIEDYNKITDVIMGKEYEAWNNENIIIIIPQKKEGCSKLQPSFFYNSIIFNYFIAF